MNYHLKLSVLGTFIIGKDDYVIAGLLPSIAKNMESRLQQPDN
ncbi:hypothetical protein [Sediminibacillus halophilus]|uniref:Uncharacterized protein n=1 Tax=Sediminibacillus halophilus TaxID=482461 RepID=A0A1G9R4I8_9BACI|nr:hypothetical protein [Sediminibacillus halophilus]SDM18216.1 hypothetical protein SAMN05216244_1818 [Sediminibacillus halophilus]